MGSHVSTDQHDTNQTNKQSNEPSTGDSVPIYSNLSQIYADVNPAVGRYAALASRFHATYGQSNNQTASTTTSQAIGESGNAGVPTFYVRAPGRVNLIGEHIDYCGYSVLPMAIDRDTVIACTINQSTDASSERAVDQPIQLANYDPAYQACTFQNNKELFLINQSTKPVASNNQIPFWARYFQCGFKGVFEAVKNTGDSSILTNEQSPKMAITDTDYYGYKHHSLSLLISGTVPPSAGLSSSSSLVCAAALCAAFAHGYVKTVDRSVDRADEQSDNQSITPSVKFTKKQLSEICCACERYIGTMGGGMDQSISFLSERGVAQLIDFNPLANTSIKLPTNSVFVVCNSLYESSKAINAASQFNLRVVECKLAAVMLHCYFKKYSKSNGTNNQSNNQSTEQWFKTLTLKQVQQESGLSLTQMVECLNSSSGPLKRDIYNLETIDQSIKQTLNQSISQLMSYNPKFVDVLSSINQFRLFDRALHVYSEATRVYGFSEVCQSASSNQSTEQQSQQIAELGRLMSASHESCAKLYDCSCVDVDVLVSMLMSCGASGARVTGAGWGGCTVALFDAQLGQQAIQQAMDNIKRKYYHEYKGIALDDPRLAEYIFVTKPSNGAAIYVPPMPPKVNDRSVKSQLFRWGVVLGLGVVTGLLALSMASRRSSRAAHSAGHTTAGAFATGIVDNLSIGKPPLPIVK